MAIRGVSVPNEVLGRLVPGESLGDLAGDPFGRGIGGDVDPNQVTSLKADDGQSIEKPDEPTSHNECLQATPAATPSWSGNATGETHGNASGAGSARKTIDASIGERNSRQTNEDQTICGLQPGSLGAGRRREHPPPGAKFRRWRWQIVH
jgi:hypothetical protein